MAPQSATPRSLRAAGRSTIETIVAEAEAEAAQRATTMSVAETMADSDLTGIEVAVGNNSELTATIGTAEAAEVPWSSEEDGWMPKPARLHSGKTRSCAVCFAPLQYTNMASWDEYLQSELYLTQLQENLLQDAFISALICGENTAGDLPTEHRMHKNRKKKSRQNVRDYTNMTSAGVVDESGKINIDSIRILEEMLVEVLPTPVFTHVLERRLAVISHSAKIASRLLRVDRREKVPRPTDTTVSSDKLHHLAIHTLAALLGSFDYNHELALQPFEELSRILTCFPTLSLYSFWSPTKRPPEKTIAIPKENVQASSVAINPRNCPAELAVDGSEASYWQSQQLRPSVNVVYFNIKSLDLYQVSSISITWHLKSIPNVLDIEFRRADSTSYVPLVSVEVGSNVSATASSIRTHISTRFPPTCQEIRLVMRGVPGINRNANYAIEHLRLNVPTSNSLFADPKQALVDVAQWLLGAVTHHNDDIAIEAIGAMKSWSLATASLHVTMLFVQMLLKLCTQENVRPAIARFALQQGLLVSGGIKAYGFEENLRIQSDLDKQKSSDSRNVRAGFEPSVCSSGVVVEEGGQVVRTRETSYQYAAVNCGISFGRASWRFRLDNDTADDEMTCFGAAILPVTVSGYDSSPNLWMLRGYNGNLYARGHKLSRSIGKVHPGDIVQIDVDMSEGTLSYQINTTDYGVVFSDLAGHEVYPAVSFYGSGKVITLLGVQKWDATPSGVGSAEQEPTYLANLKECYFSVGYGTLGKGSQLGYVGNGSADSQSSRTPQSTSTAASARSSSIILQGEAKQRSLSTHPPANGDAYVIYDLAEAFQGFRASVAFNDDTSTEQLVQRSVAVVFSVLGDGKVLWQSGAIADATKTEYLELDVQGVRMLELRASCAGSNYCAHAVWVDPCLLPMEEWYCDECSFVNKGSAKVCALCHVGERAQSVKGTKLDTDAQARNQLDDDVTVAGASLSGESLGDDMTLLVPALENLAATISVQITELYQFSSKDAKNGRDTSLHSSLIAPRSNAAIGFEEPFARQPGPSVFLLLLNVLKRFKDASNATSRPRTPGVVRSASSSHEACVAVLDMISANLESFERFDATDSTGYNHDDLSITVVSQLRHELSALANVYGNDSSSGDLELATQLELAAARTIMAGYSTLYPSSAEKLELFLMLLRAHGENALKPTSARFMILEALLQHFSSPTGDGILTLLPRLNDDRNDDGDSIASDLAKETIDLLFDVVLKAHMKQLESAESATTPVVSGDKKTDTDISNLALNLLKKYQLFLLAEAIEHTKSNGDTREERADAKKDEERQTELRRQQERALVQETVTQFVTRSLNTYRSLVESVVATQADEAFLLPTQQAALLGNVRARNLPLLSEGLPWLVSCLCLLRRQTWLARPILPTVARLLGTFDHYCSELQVASKSAYRLQQLDLHLKTRSLEAQVVEHSCQTSSATEVATHGTKSTRQLYNVFKQLYTGEKDHFEGQIGFQFEASSSFTVIALGRSVNATRNSGRLIREHNIRLWDEATQMLIAELTVNGASRKDHLGYAVELLPSPVKITQGKLYRLTTQEYANGGDPWYKKENLPDEEYDSSYIKILRDCYASGSTGFPNSQNLSGAAYGVPTFLVDDESLLSSIPRFVPVYGTASLKFNVKRKSKALVVSHSGISASCVGDNEVWRTCFVRTPFLHGVHSVDFVVKSARAGGILSGHSCIGVDWSERGDAFLTDGSRNCSFIGSSAKSIGWMPSIGAIWVEGIRCAYGPRLSLTSGDILTLAIDFDQNIISFSYNGKDMGIALGPSAFTPSSSSLSQLPSLLVAGVSVYGTQDVVQLRPSGVAKTTLRLHWLFDLHGMMASLAGRLTSSLISGQPVDCIEEELLPWLESSLLSGGIADDPRSTSQFKQYQGGQQLSWKDAVRLNYDKFPSSSDAPPIDLFGESTSRISSVSDASDMQEAWRRSSSSARDSSSALEVPFWEQWTNDMTENGSVQFIISWMEKVAPDRSFLSRLGSFPLCERWYCAALIKYAPVHVHHEVTAVIAAYKQEDSVQHSGTNAFVGHTELTPSDDLLTVWKRIIMLRHWLIKSRQEFRARQADEAEVAGATTATATWPPASGEETRKTATPRFYDGINVEDSFVVPRSFDDLVAQVSQRGQFLCLLSPPSENSERLRPDSHRALSDLADKWSVQNTPPSLQPMIERWKSLGEADSSKWAGIVDVLRAQEQWRSKQASSNAGASQSDFTEESLLGTGLEENAPFRYKDSFVAMMKACDMYIRSGVGAPPEILHALLERRRRRADSRVFGLQAMKAMLSLLSFDGAIHNMIIFLRPALRGFTDSEKESRELNDGQIVAETFRATVRHHYLKGLEGCSRQCVQRVHDSFWGLYGHLTQLIRTNAIHDPQLKQAILCAWSLDFDASDHQFILESQILSTLHDMFSIQGVRRQLATDNTTFKKEGTARRDMREHASACWQSLSLEFVQRGMLHSGYLTKRDVVGLLHCAPPYSCSLKWWDHNELEMTEAANAVTLAARHTASSLSLLYSEMLAGLQQKLALCETRLSDRKALQFGAKVTQAQAHSGGSSASSTKPDGVSYVEMPALGNVTDFTIELWVYPTDLSGYRSLRCDNGLNDGSAYLELVEGYVQISIPGNYPREHLFSSHRLETYEWTHLAVVYTAEARSVELVINGKVACTKSYDVVCPTLTFRSARVGCWMSEVDAQGSPLASAVAQRLFVGSLAEVRIWSVARGAHEIARDFQLSTPFGINDTTPRPTTEDGAIQQRQGNLIALWHLNEGVGMHAYDQIPTQSSMEGMSVDEEGYHANICSCHWVTNLVPVFTNAALEQMANSPKQWDRVIASLSCFQRYVRQWLSRSYQASIKWAKLANEHNEMDIVQRQDDFQDEDDDDDNDNDRRTTFDDDSGAEAAGIDSATKQMLAAWDLFSVDQVIARKQSRKCAWVVFRFLASVGISGTSERREEEAQLAASTAKLKRKSRLQKIDNKGPVNSPMHGGRSDLSAGQTYEEDDDVARNAEAASDAAKLAASNRDLEEPMLQTLWFSMEFHRKVFEMMETELMGGMELTKETEGLTRAQRMLRSVSTPVQQRGYGLLLNPSDLSRDNAMFTRGHGAAPGSDSSAYCPLETLELELHMFGIISFMLSQSTRPSVLSHIARRRMLHGLLELLRVSSPRCQRVVKLLLRRICCSETIKPVDVSALLGSESVLVDLLLDQVAESVCSSAAPLPTHGVSVPATSSLVVEAESSLSITESLCNPMGFRSGQIHLAAASESVALLRLLLMNPHWQARVAELLCGAIKKIAPILLRRKSDSVASSKGTTTQSDLRVRAAIIRAVGALCVLGSHSDCLRIGGKVRVAAGSDSEARSDVATGDYGYNFSATDTRMSMATLIEMNGAAASVRVVFDALSSEEVFDPTHNVQEVHLTAISPTEEILLPSNIIPLTVDMMPVILQLSSLDEASVLTTFDDLWRLQIRSRALLALESILRAGKQITTSTVGKSIARNLLGTALAPVDLSTFVSLPVLQERGRMILCRLIESASPLGESMFRRLPDPESLLKNEEPENNESRSRERFESIDNPNEEESEEYRTRRGFASTLAAMGFEFDLCMAALEHSRNDPNLAVEWLMGPAAAAYLERQSAQRLAEASLAARRSASLGDGTDVSDTQAKAEEIMAVSGMPLSLCIRALELWNNDPNRAMEWLMEYGTRYLERDESLSMLEDDFHSEEVAVLDDRAALEGVDQTDPLVESRASTSTCTSTVEALANASTDVSNVMPVTLAPILARLPAKPAAASISSRGTAADGDSSGYAPLSSEYLQPYVLLTVSAQTGPIQRMQASGQTGIFRKVSDSDGVLITFLNTETGAYEDEWHLPKDVRRITKFYDEELDGVESIHHVALKTEGALATHYARRAAVALLSALTMGSGRTDASARPANRILDIVAGPRQFLKLMKLVAAPEMTLARSRTDSTTTSARKIGVGVDSPQSGVAKRGDDDMSLLESLHALLIRALRDESTSKRDSDDEKAPVADGEEIESLDKSEAQATSVERVADQSELSLVLVEECVSHLLESTRAAETGLSGCTNTPSSPSSSSEEKEFQSLHPYFGQCDYSCAVSLSKSYRSVRIVFDRRCKLAAKTTLSFFSDPGCENRIATVDSSTSVAGKGVPDVIVHGHQFWFRFTAAEDDAFKNYGYGYRFQVRPMTSIQWTKEADVLSQPSLDWACWVLEFLLNDASDLIARGAVHNRRIFEALVQYLRSSGAPFKSRVTSLLLQLLHTPEAFPASEVPDLSSIDAIATLAMERAQADIEGGKRFVSAHLLQLVELLVAIQKANEVFNRTRCGSSASPDVMLAPVGLPTSPERKTIADNLSDTASIVRFLLGEVDSLPQHVLTAIWLDVYGATGFVETAHPYAPGSAISGSQNFAGAQTLQLTFDPRCSVTREAANLDVVVSMRNSAVPFVDQPHEPRSGRSYTGADEWPTSPVCLEGDTLDYTFLGDDNTRGHYGFIVTVVATGITREKQLARLSLDDLAQLQSKLLTVPTPREPAAVSEECETSSSMAWTTSMDSQLADWVNNHIETRNTSVRSVDLKPTDIRLNPTLDGLRCSHLLGLPLEVLCVRFALLKYLNQCLKECLPLLDLRDTQSPWTLAHRLRLVSHCVFFDVKNSLVEAAIDATNVAADTTTPGASSASTNTARITLDRLQALESRDDREVEPSVSQCFFAQAFRQLQHVDPALFRRRIDSKGRLFSVKFRGEEGVDWGGVYREGANSMVDDLFSPHFGLFVLCPNGQHDTGINRSMYLPNPKCTSPVAVQMYEFVGKLLGISLRTHGDFPFAFPSLVWKQLVRQPLVRADLESTDAMLVQMLEGIAACERDGISDEAEFEAAFAGLDLRFTVSNCNGEPVELVEGGRMKRVTFANRLEYCRLAEEYRLYEGAAQVAAMRRGFSALFPARVLTLLTWQETELLACGSPKIDLAVWKQHTRYDGYNEHDEPVQLFWDTLASFSDEQRADFVRFAWGRSRLPRGKWPQPFKLTKKSGRDATQSLPVAHTCFFSVELPPYATAEKMQQMLLATITFGLGGILMA